MSRLDNIAIATIGYVCESRFVPVTRATHGYVCPTGISRRRGGGHGGALRLPRQPTETIVLPESDDEQLAVLAILAIEEMYE